MQLEHEIFLSALKCGLLGQCLPDRPEVTQAQWEHIFKMAQEHQVLPLIFEAVYRQSGLSGSRLQAGVRPRVLKDVFVQTGKTAEFLALYRKLRAAGVTPLVVKGLICRSLYPQPDHRPSGDEDILIPPEQFETAHRVMLEFGMTAAEAEENFQSSYEIPYGKMGSALYIELHKSLFPPESGAYGHLNGFFEGVHDRAAEEIIEGVPVLSMGPTDHLFYLICHAFKHFLHSGFGIRQVCDIMLYANRYGGQIDWKQVMGNCRSIRADRFAAAMFRMGEKYLVFEPDKACYPDSWREMEVDEAPMLMDLLDSGIYGASDMSRKHSATITLTAVENQKNGKKAGGVMRSLFPAAENLQGRYPYLKKHPALLPVAWVSRILRYGKETLMGTNNNAADSIRIGGERVELMKQYGILDQ